VRTLRFVIRGRDQGAEKRMIWLAASLLLVHLMVVDSSGGLVIHAAAAEPCLCLENGGEPGPGDCPCNVSQCYHDCVDELCPDTPNCTMQCSHRCTCESAPPECPDHEDPGFTPTPIPSATPACVGDCDADGFISIDELVRSVNIAVRSLPISLCSNCDEDGDSRVGISELITAVNNALTGCASLTHALDVRAQMLAGEI